MKITTLTTMFSRWFSNAADIPDSIRITIPMLVSLGLFYSLGFTSAGISGLITAWLLGTQARNLPYLKRLQILSISALITVIATYLAFLVFDNTWLSAITLCSIAILYGLMSNQRPHIRSFGYNFGFIYIMAIHFASVGDSLTIIMMANIFAGLCVTLSSLILWPFFKGRILQQHTVTVHNALADWLNELRFSDNDAQLATRRQFFYQSAHNLAYFSNSVSSPKRALQIKIELQRLLEMSEYIICLERVLSFDLHQTTRVRLFKWIEITVEQLKNNQQITETFATNEYKNTPYIIDIIEKFKRCYNFDTFSTPDYSKNIYLFTSDSAAFISDFCHAIKANSKEWRHAGKIAITLAVTQFLTEFYHLPQGYWISLTAFIVLLTSSMAVTNHRIWNRFSGTALGGIYCFICLYFVSAQHLILLTSISVFFAFTSYHKERYDIHVFWLTSMIVFAISLLSPDNTYVSFYRIIDTLFGVTIAFSVNYFIAPSWTITWLDRHTASMIKSQILYVAVLDKPQWEQKINLYQSQQHYYALNGEVMNLLKEPNLSPRTSKDWLSLLVLIRRLNDSLLLATKLGIQSDKPQSTARWVNQLQWVKQTFPDRCKHGEMPPFNTETTPIPEDMLCALIEKDIQQLTAWMLYQRAFVV
ncbi:FUSC family protein [Photobacterium phosphoreum]|uniref:FUSC family protein n=1 Tax=Photobacterium phosphoreum TaxID=659 RepID=UPI001E4C4ECE|nr:FUSC family protein [Photobacterium phosphoreum]MCD9519692.1 FUSC family protein [Photobacterium phosphoreum]